MNPKILHSVYYTLFEEYGRQNWWPADNAFEVAIGAILTQNTSWKNVEHAILNLKKNDLIYPEKISCLSHLTLSELIKPAGFFNIKSKRIMNFIAFFNEFDFDFKKLAETKNVREKMLMVKGIGRETADSILLYAMNLPYFVVDAYTKRLFFRLGLTENPYIDYDELQNQIHKAMSPEQKIYNEFHAVIVTHCKNHCRKKPVCASCVLSNICRYQG